MEEKKYLKISKELLVCLMIIVLLVIIIIGFGMYIYFLKNSKIETSQSIVDVENTEVEEQVKKSIKIDETKDYVYEKDRTEINEPLQNYTDTIYLPFVNIDSEDAQKINETLQQKYQEASTSLIRHDEYYAFEYTKMKYEYHLLLAETVLSLKVEIGDVYVSSEGFLGNCYVYNIDLETGKLLTKEQMLAKLNRVDMDAKIENEVTKQLLEEYGGYYGFETLEDVYEICDLENYEIFVKDENTFEICFPYCTDYMKSNAMEPETIVVELKK